MKILVEGWISYPHSYSLVNVYQLLALNKKDNVKIYFNELPPYKDEWNVFSQENTLDSLINPEEKRIILDIEKWNGQPVDVVYRIAFPYDLKMTRGVEKDRSSKIRQKTFHDTVNSVPLVLFYTAEFQKLYDSHFSNENAKSFVSSCFDKRVIPITPSNWSAEALRKKRFDPIVIAHGVDVQKYYPNTSSIDRDDFREEYSIPSDAFVFLNVGAMTDNKNVKLMLKTFYRLSLWRDDIYLLLKGIGDLYRCEKNITDTIRNLIKEGIVHKNQWKKISKNVIFIDELFTYDQMRTLYNSVDCYLSPYIAEGFNLPVLEAAACGLPVIVSKGGSTDDFTTSDFAKYPKTYTCKNIQDAQHSSTETKENYEVYLIVDEGSLLEAMMSIIDDKSFRNIARVKAPAHVQQFFTWDIVTDKLCNFLQFITPDIMPNMTNSCHSDLVSMP